MIHTPAFNNTFDNTYNTYDLFWKNKYKKQKISVFFGPKIDEREREPWHEWRQHVTHWAGRLVPGEPLLLDNLNWEISVYIWKNNAQTWTTYIMDTFIGKYLSIFGKTLRKHRQPIIRILFDKRRSLMIKLGQVPKWQQVFFQNVWIFWH